MNNPFNIDDLWSALPAWMQLRRKSVDWVYHPRKTDVSDYIRRKFLADLLATSTSLKSRARETKIVCDLNVSLKLASGRARKLDLILGPPESELPGEALVEGPIVKARVAHPMMTLETKLCMTEHRKATSRLIDELLSSLDLVRGVAPKAICVAIVVVNVSDRFTSPTNLPGPNLHDRPQEIVRLVDRLLTRISIGAPNGYDVLSVSLIDTDNELRFDKATGGPQVPADRSYSTAVQIVSRLYDQAGFG